LALPPGTRLGVYEVTTQIGAGGMGEVYRATDTNLKRQVALKVLPLSVAADADRLARFQREAEVLASLNHPHIGAIYGLEKNAGLTALVMELVEGEDLADRIARGPIPLDQALPIAKQIAEALEAAHEQGIIHRDLKPANIKVRDDDTIKVLDFGLAKAIGSASSSAAATSLADSPTITSPAAMTAAGIILGTAAYMSPEQARGKLIDKRTDIWAFGCVLYEMVTGARAFSGDGVSDTIAHVLMKEPDWTRLPAGTPASIRRLLGRCLEKDSRRRLRDIGDVRLELDDGSQGETAHLVATSAAIRSRNRERLAWFVAAVLAVALGVTSLWVRIAKPATDAPSIARTTIVLPSNQKLASGGGAYPLALARDGSRLAYVAEVEGRTQLYIRELTSLEPKAVVGTTGAEHPFFSPDGQWVGFFAAGALQKVAVAGGAPLRICNVSTASNGASWGSDNTIVFAVRQGGLLKVSASGGTPEPLQTSGPASWPDVLPDGRTVLFITAGEALATMSIAGGERRVLARTHESKLGGPAVLGTGYLLQPRYVPSGHIIYGQSPGIVRAVPFDPASLKLTGSPVSIVDSVEQAPGAGAVFFASSQTGLMIYASTGERHSLVWVDRRGNVATISADRLAFRLPRLAPDGRRVAVAINDDTRRSDIWIYDAERGTKSRVTADKHNLDPVWTPDGTHLTFSNVEGIQEVSTEGGSRELLVAHRPGQGARSWSPDGRTLLLSVDDATGSDVWAFSRGSTPRPLLVRSFADTLPRFSPDGKWVAWVSNESGDHEVYVAHYPDLDGKVAVSTNGGTHPVWARDGRELFYRQGDALMSVPVNGTGREFTSGKPTRLFAGSFSGAGRDPSFDVAPDGQRFVMIKSDDASTLRQLTVVQNWFEELKRLAPTR
jgi:eukaryotic-like serine/threonine-protein kinase